jgi:uncharacterized protein YndB with AHSA1/START domain
MAGTSTPEPTVLSTERWLPHPPDAVYAAFADPAQLARWWGPEGFTNTFETFDFRPDGRWEFVMHGPAGGHYPNASVFRTLTPAALVVIEHVSPPPFTLSVHLAPDGEGTRLRWAQAFTDPALADRFRASVVPANEQNLDRLAALLGDRRA